MIVDKTAPSQNETITMELELPHAPAKVWRALTDPVLLAEWLLPVVGLKLELQPKAAFTFQTKAYPPWDGTVNCRFIEIEAQKKLSYAWVVGSMTIDTIVTFTLTPTATGTRLSLEHRGFKPDQAGAFGGQRYGWNMEFGKLIELLGRTA